jgi:hypothetical protein
MVNKILKTFKKGKNLHYKNFISIEKKSKKRGEKFQPLFLLSIKKFWF